MAIYFRYCRGTGAVRDLAELRDANTFTTIQRQKEPHQVVVFDRSRRFSGVLKATRRAPGFSRPLLPISAYGLPSASMGEYRLFFWLF